MAAARAELPAGQAGPVKPADQSSEALADWPDPVELAIGLEVQYLPDEARTTHFGDLDPAVDSAR